MDIIKLGDICTFQSGTTKLPKNYKKNGTTFFINYKDVYSAKALYKNDLAKISIFSHINYDKNMVFKNDLLITCSSETSIDNGMVSIYVDESPVLLNGFCKKITIDKKIVIGKYLFFLLNNKKNRKIISTCSNGITRHNILWNQLKQIKLYIPNISIQQSIIDIIEPFEILVESVFKKIKINEKITELIINNFYRENGLFKENEIKFLKGINFKKEMISENNSDILFINVSAINDKPNKFIKLEYINMVNVFEGDVILSLDGNTGLVNNCLKGINGYGYKIASNNIKNSQIYYSLLSKINQDIIDQNSFGTTIQHASKSKDKIIILNFGKNQKILDIFFDLEIIYKKKVKLLKKIISSLIEIYTK